MKTYFYMFLALAASNAVTLAVTVIYALHRFQHDNRESLNHGRWHQLSPAWALSCILHTDSECDSCVLWCYERVANMFVMGVLWRVLLFALSTVFARLVLKECTVVENWTSTAKNGR